MKFSLGHGAGSRSPHRRTIETRRCGGRRSASDRAVFSIRPLPADLVQPSRRDGGDAARAVERQARAAVGQQVHHQHQYRDELLAGGGYESLRVARASVRPDRSGASRRPPHREGDLRRARLRAASQHRYLGRCGADRRRRLRHLADGRRMVEPSLVGSLRLHARPPISRRARLSRDEGGRRVSARLPGRRRQRASGHRAIALSRKHLQTSERRDREALHGADYGHRNHAPALHPRDRRRRRFSASTPISAPR